jgi:hypothetical protein
MEITNLIEQARLALRLMRERPVEIRLFGSEEARAAYRNFTRPHRHLPVLRNKTFGVALMPVPAKASDPLSGPHARASRQRRKRALQRGYTFAAFNGSDHIDEILAINRSASVRQGKPLSSSYTSADAVTRYSKQRSPFFGVFDSTKVLRAYCHAPTVGEVAVLARFLGEHDRLQDGIMTLMFSEIVLHFAGARAAAGNPHWIMYDTYIGGTAGMRIFKARCGFGAYRVKWLWTDGPGA